MTRDSVSSPRNPGFEEAVEIMAVERLRHRWQVENRGCSCGWLAEVLRSDLGGEDQWRLHVESSNLTALLDAKQTETCETCGGTGTIDGEPGNGYPHGNRVGCPGCGGAGRAPGTVPLVILAPVLAHPTVKIPDDVPGWEGVTLPAAYHDPLRDGSFDFGSRSE